MIRYKSPLPPIPGRQSNRPKVDLIYHKETVENIMGHLEPPKPQYPHPQGTVKDGPTGKYQLQGQI